LIKAFGENPSQRKKSGAMLIKKNPTKKPACRSQLIRVIRRLYNLKDHAETKNCQNQLDRMKNRHSVLSQPARLELIADLISEKKGFITRSERKALEHLSKSIIKEKKNNHSILDFSIDYLVDTIEENIIPPPLLPPDLINKTSACKTIATLSLTGMVMSGCTQNNDPVQPKNEKNRQISLQKTKDAQQDKQNPISKPLVRNVKKEKPVAKFFTYSVKKGDSLRKIAESMGVDYREVARFNNIKYDKKRNWFKLHAGQKLILSKNIKAKKIAAKEIEASKESYLSLKKTADPGSDLLHFVVKGDSLWKISKQYNVPLEKIAKANNIKNLRKIRYGNILKIPGKTMVKKDTGPFNKMSKEDKISFIKERTIKEGRPYIDAIVEISEEYKVDPRLYASLIWEESWFDSNARSKDNCRKLAQLDPRFHEISEDTSNNFRKSLGYLRHEFVYYSKKGFDKKSSAICALAAYNGGDTRIRRLIRTGEWDGKRIETIPIPETREYLKKIFRRCENNYQAVL
jgi:LysM repeat protein